MAKKGKKEIEAYIKLQIPAGEANPSPPVGPALGQHGLPLMDFCNAFNARTKDLEPGLPCPVVITVYEDKSFDFVIKTTPAAVLIKKAAGIKPCNDCLAQYPGAFNSRPRKEQGAAYLVPESTVSRSEGYWHGSQ